MSDFAAQHSLFRAYDIRGIHGLFTNDFVTTLGQAFSQLYRAQPTKSSTTAANSNLSTVVIGYDVRCGSDTIALSIAHTLSENGLAVVFLGLVTTPMMAFWAGHFDGHGIMVTASHSAKDNLGIKWLVDNASPSATDIQQLYRQLSSVAASHANDTNGHHSDRRPMTYLSKATVATTYIDAITAVFARLYPQVPFAKIDLRIVIDCMHGATSNIAYPLFSTFFTHIIMLNNTPNGDFPTGNPDPTEPNRLAELQQTVIVAEADVGLAFDGDGDRLMVVDNSGKVIAPDHLLYLLAQVALTELPSTPDIVTKNDDKAANAPQVLFDIKCSHHLPTLLQKLGATPIMTRTGSSLLRQQLQSDAHHALFAGELSGHFIFNDGHHIVYDDAMYAGLRLLHWLRRSATPAHLRVTNPQIITDVWGEPRNVMPYTMTDITQHLPTLISTADHYLPLPDSQACGCSVVEHLIGFCHYLQHVATHTVVYKRAAIHSLLTLPSSCLPTSMSITPEHARQLLPTDTRLTCIDGIRLDFSHGFGVLRESNTSHSLTVRFAADSIKDLQDVQARFVALCQPFDRSLAAQIAAITAE